MNYVEVLKYKQRKKKIQMELLRKISFLIVVEMMRRRNGKLLGF